MSFNIKFTETALEDYEYWKKSNNKKIIDKIKILLKNIQETPFTGLGKPEPLKHQLSGYWSRRINREHRIVYKVEEEIIFIIALRYHY